MVDSMFILTRILFISCCFLTVHYNCTSVTDFHDCLGSLTDFCPEHIICAYKDSLFVSGENYWYMGGKSDQLWTLFYFMIHETKEDNPYIYPSYNCDGSLGTAKPKANYGNNYSSHSFSTPEVPKSSYIQKEATNWTPKF
ncbi:unnamed protein product [Nyctereutes procyonoides]|uniref:(raccoon dog) hypothetical protein n=1 Tax=Nyctereutes procyonoides TaxID=34880 RepID=A0A811YXE4_NYCPR|nr:unnamed protein product [Nyctereutes procyonoides]